MNLYLELLTGLYRATFLAPFEVMFSKKQNKPLSEVIETFHQSIPDEEWNKLPTDLASTVDERLYGNVIPFTGK